MNIEQMRATLTRFHDAVDVEADRQRDSYLAIERLMDLYRELGPEERSLANLVLEEWAASDDEKKRFDARALIDAFGITDAIPALERLLEKLDTQDSPGAPFEAQIVRRLIDRVRDRSGQ
jgi:hypothetical protein